MRYLDQHTFDLHAEFYRDIHIDPGSETFIELNTWSEGNGNGTANLEMQSSSSVNGPILNFTNKNSDDKGTSLSFVKTKTAADGDVPGIITFDGYAAIVGAVLDASDTEGAIQLSVVSGSGLGAAQADFWGNSFTSSGQLIGNVIKGYGNGLGVVNVDLALGATSTTTIAGGISIGGHIVNDIDIAGEFVDSDEHLMTSAAIDDRINAAVSGTFVDLTSEVSGILPVANGGTGASSLTDNKLLTGTGTSAVTAEANATYDGADLTLTSATSTKPILTIENTTNDANAGELKLIGRRSADASVIAGAGDDAGTISFVGENAKTGPDPETITYGKIVGENAAVTDGAEMGKLSMTVAKSGSLVNLFNGYAGATGTVATFGDGGLLGSTTFDSTITQFQSTTSTGPIMSIVNGTNDATGASLSFYNSRGGTGPGGAANQNGDDLGTLKWIGYDAGAVQTVFAQILGEANEVTAGSEEGKLTLSVASHDAEMQPGLMMVSGNAEDEVDVTIGNGSTSVVTVPGRVSTNRIDIDGVGITAIQTASESFADNDNSLMTSAAIDDRIAAAGGGVSVSDSTANTDFPVVFHDESNNLHDDTGAFTYNPSTGNAVIPKIQTAGNIELGHASDTTIARSGAGRVTIEGNTIITAGDEVVSAGNHILKQTKVTIDTSGFNGLNSTPVDLVAAQGANTMIVPTEVVVFADRAATNTNSTDLIVAYNGGTSFATAVKYIRRFMQNVTTDRTTIMGPYVGTASNDLTTPINSKLTIALGAAPTTNCMTSLTVYTSYYVIDIS